MDRNETIARVRSALRKRSGKAWSVTGGRGTAWGWIEIESPPRRRTFDFQGVDEGEPGHYMGHVDRDELAKLLGLPDRVHAQGVSIPAGGDYRQEYVDRAEGRAPSVIGTPYWD